MVKSLQRIKKSPALTIKAPFTGHALLSATDQSRNLSAYKPLGLGDGGAHRKLSGMVRILHFKSAHFILKKQSNAAKIRMRSYPSNLVISELLDRDAVGSLVGYTPKSFTGTRHLGYRKRRSWFSAVE